MLVVALLSCSCQPKGTVYSTRLGAGDEEIDPKVEFRKLTKRWLAEHATRYPAGAVESGLHAYDGKLRDVSDAGLVAEGKALKKSLAEFEATDPAALGPLGKVERGVVLQTIRAGLFELERLRKPWKNPMFYLGDLNLAPYISREYAPLADRARAIAALANAAPEHLARGEARLDTALPRTFIDTALLQVRGTLDFVATDVPAAMKGLDSRTASELEAALAAMTAGLQHYEQFLVRRRLRANTGYALGPQLYLAMLRETQGIDIDLERLEAIGKADLARNMKALRRACAEIDPTRSVAAIVERVAQDKPAADAVLAEATRQAADMRKFLLERKLVTIPSEDVAEVRPSPPFMRWNAAFLSSAGVFEENPLPSFYYISPPDPSWPEKQQRAYVPGKTDLLFITIHEVWPGHFLHGLHLKASRSAVLKSAWNYATGEGWAHYAEEMMWDQGLSIEPAVHIGQLQNALLRNVRFMSALGLHTQRMSVAESEKLFRTQAFQDPASARQQAVRGTFDPMYLSYTLGKLAIKKLRDDVKSKWEAEGKLFTLRAFHDQLLSYGAAPLPLIRQAMLGPDAGPLL